MHTVAELASNRQYHRGFPFLESMKPDMTTQEKRKQELNRLIHCTGTNVQAVGDD